jgi:hypothetical protein
MGVLSPFNGNAKIKVEVEVELEEEGKMRADLVSDRSVTWIISLGCI